MFSDLSTLTPIPNLDYFGPILAALMMRGLDEVTIRACDTCRGTGESSHTCPTCGQVFAQCPSCRGTRNTTAKIADLLGGSAPITHHADLLQTHADLLQMKGHRIGHFLALWLADETFSKNEKNELYNLLEWRNPPIPAWPACVNMLAISKICSEWRRILPRLRPWLGLAVDLTPEMLEKLLAGEPVWLEGAVIRGNIINEDLLLFFGPEKFQIQVFGDPSSRKEAGTGLRWWDPW